MLTVGKWVLDPTLWLNEILTFFTVLWSRWIDRAPASVQPVTNVLYADKRLAAAIGLEESIIVTRLLAWQRYNAAKKKHETHKRDGKWYTYNSVEDWVLDFGGAFKATTLGRYLRKLEDMKLVQTGQFLKAKGDVRKWYHVDEKALQNLVDHASKAETPSCQNGKMVVSKRHTTTRAKTAVSSNPQANKTSTPKDARAQNTDVDDVSTASTGEHLLERSEGADATSTFEGNAHESDAPERGLSPSSAAPLPEMVQVLVNAPHYLNDLVAREYLEKHGVEHCERVAVQALKGTNPPGLWRDLLDKGAYKHSPDQPAVVQGKRDDWIIK